MPESIVFNEDCMKGMKRYPDKYFDLAIVDPPYGLGTRTTDGGTRKNSLTKFMKDIRRTNWDNEIPSESYFNTLFNFSKNQIIWGGNYFALPPCRNFIVWDKMTFIPTMSRVEMAWTSFNTPAKLIEINSNNCSRIHPTQKPVKLYEWILLNYAKPGDKILDTHVGSGSSRIAAYKHGFDYVGFEIDKEYFEAQGKRFNEFKAQQTFDF